MAKGSFQQWMREAQQKAMDWSYGRNGIDDLSFAITNVAVLLVIIDLFAGTTWLSIVALVMLVIAWLRIASKKVAARRRENAEFAKRLGPAAIWLAHPINAAREAKAYKHLSCPDCGQRVRIPRGKGKVRVTCPKCRTRFEGKA